MRKFENEQANVLASYYNSKVIALYKNEVIYTTITSNNNKVVVYYFEDEPTPEGYEKKDFLFEDFINEVINSGNCYIGHIGNNKDEWSWHTDAYTSYTKEVLDNYLSDINTTKEDKDRYNFLFKDK